MAGGAAAVASAILYFTIGGEFICTLLTFLPPAYKSFKAIETKDSGDDTQWLTYWVVWATFSGMHVHLMCMWKIIN